MCVLFSNLRMIFNIDGTGRFYPSFIKEIDCYEEYVSKNSLITYTAPPCAQWFQAEIDDSEGNRLFSLEWDINQIQKQRLTHSLKAHRFSTLSKNIFCDERNVHPERVRYYIDRLKSEKTNPIFLVWIEFVHKYYIIDGNHRFVAHKQSGHKTIEAIILPSGIHLKCMLSEESRMRYKIFHNLSIMENIISYPKCKVSEEMEDNGSLYPITGNKIVLGSIRCWRFRIYRLAGSLFHSMIDK